MNTVPLIGMAVTGLAVFLGGCASTSNTRSEPKTGATTAPVHEHSMGMMSEMCPMEVPGTAVTSTDVEGGVALVFTTSTGDVAELRQRVRHMAEMHNRHHAGGGMMGEHEHGAADAPAHGGSGSGMMQGGMMMPAATASVEDIERGARVVLRPKDPAQLEALREHARMAAGRMAGGECPMMSSGTKGTTESGTPGPGPGDHEGHHPSPPGK